MKYDKFDLNDEYKDQEHPFIPTDKFYHLLSSTINSFNNKYWRRNIWIHGSYGTGKSRAASIIKRLLIHKNVYPSYLKYNHKKELDEFHQNNNVLPIILKDVCKTEPFSKFVSDFQETIKTTLELKNITIFSFSNFKNIIKLLKEQTIILHYADLKGTNLELLTLNEIILKLENHDYAVLNTMEKILEKKGITINFDILDQLPEIEKELYELYGINHIIIFWDNFNEVLEHENAEKIILEIQKIIETMSYIKISFFIISQKTQSSNENVNDIIKQILPFFTKINYNMNPISGYQIIENISNYEFNKLESFSKEMSDIIEKINKKNNPLIKKTLEKSYPIHPYTSYLTIFLAKEMGFSERTILEFLYDSRGISSLMNTYCSIKKQYLTAETLFDFFYKTFEKNNSSEIKKMLQFYKKNYENFNNQEIPYITIFKVIILLNILSNITADPLILPNRNNINNAFKGDIYENKVDEVLNYINEKGIITETSKNYFEITTNMLDQKEVKAKTEKIKKNIGLNTILNKEKLSKIMQKFAFNVIREVEIKIKEGNIQKNKLITDLRNDLFKKPGYLHILLFLCKDEKELIEIKKTINTVKKEDLLNDTIVIISESSFKEKKLNEFIEYKVKAEISEKHYYKEKIKLYNNLADKLAKEWVHNIKNGTIQWYFNDNEGQSTLREFTKIIDEKISKQIFYKGMENINKTRRDANWTYKIIKYIPKCYLSSKSYEELSSKLQERFLSILQDNNENLIVNNNLELKDTAPDNHPIKLLQDFVDNQFKKARKKGEFNLGIELRPLTEPPYGLYPNEVNIAALSFVMRKYINQLYDENGLVINEAQMNKKVLNIFDYWDKNKKGEKLRVRFGSEDKKID